MERLELSDMIVGLRSELIEAQNKAENRSLQFNVDSIDIEVKVTVAMEGKADAGIKWKFWVFTEAEAKATGSIKNETVHTIRLKLTPEHEAGPLKISRQGQRPE